ncbi:MAG TPA: phosphate ABC transporter permease PstA [Methanomassiliicoccales archaeon]|nr:phosphate ABC transporter permease PstA [Methanomassiliicoccales archaeon]
MNRKTKEILYFSAFRGCALLVVLSLLVLVGYIATGGLERLSLDFLTEMPRRANTQGGIFPAIVGTFYLMLIVLAVSVPIGVMSAIYLVEYEQRSWMGRLFKLAVYNLAGVPSIVYGLLGLGIFVAFLGFGFSLISAGLTLSIMALPLMIAASREAISAVPYSVREASFALGATKWQTIWHHVLPYALPGIFTGIILSVSRAAGETAPLMLTGVAVSLQRLPDSFFDSFMALPYHVYYMATQSSNLLATRPIQFATALVLILSVLGMNLVAIVMRKRYRDKYKW